MCLQPGNNQLLLNIQRIYDAVNDSGVEESYFEAVQADLDKLIEYLDDCITLEAIFFAYIFHHHFEQGACSLRDIGTHINLKSMYTLTYQPILDLLVEKGFIEVIRSSKSRRMLYSGDEYVVNPILVEAIIKNKPLPKLKNVPKENLTNLLEQFNKLNRRRIEGDISTMELAIETECLMDENQHFPLIKQLIELDFNEYDYIILLQVIWKTICGNQQMDLSRIINHIFENHSDRIETLQALISGEHPLIVQELVEIIPARFFNDTEIALTDKMLAILTEAGLKIFQPKKRDENVIYPEDITTQTLIFNEKEMPQLDIVKKSLMNEHFLRIQSRLVEKNMPKGVTMLFHGAPGTGKTELVKQLAKASNRSILKIEVSQTKSKWFGESEKLIKNVFKEYLKLCENSEITPIIFFNEADAIISKRKKITASSVAQTENAIQNIILEELENFEGIFMATTNLTENLDTAFDRRFLFKVEFTKPDMNTRLEIWQSKLPQLEAQDLKYLAQHYDFSGGQIDNIVRKCFLKEVIYGELPNLAAIAVFCNEEQLHVKKTSIGFSAINN